MPAFGANVNTTPFSTQGSELYPGAPAGMTGAPGSGAATMGAPDYGALTGGAGMDFGNGVRYDGLDATNIASDPMTLLQASLRGQGNFGPGSMAYYGPAFQGLDTFAYLNLAPNVDIEVWAEMMRLYDQASKTTDPTAAQALIDQADQLRNQQGFNNQAMAGLSNEYLGALQGGGIDPNKAMASLVGQAMTTENPIGLMLSQGSESEKVNAAIGMIQDTLVTSNPYMANLFVALLRWMGEKFKGDPNMAQARTGNFIQYLMGDYSGGGNMGAGTAPTQQPTYGTPQMINGQLRGTGIPIATPMGYSPGARPVSPVGRSNNFSGRYQP